MLLEIEMELGTNAMGVLVLSYMAVCVCARVCVRACVCVCVSDCSRDSHVQPDGFSMPGFQSFSPCFHGNTVYSTGCWVLRKRERDRDRGEMGIHR